MEFAQTTNAFKLGRIGQLGRVLSALSPWSNTSEKVRQQRNEEKRVLADHVLKDVLIRRKPHGLSGIKAALEAEFRLVSQAIHDPVARATLSPIDGLGVEQRLGIIHSELNSVRNRAFVCARHG